MNEEQIKNKIEETTETTKFPLKKNKNIVLGFLLLIFFGILSLVFLLRSNMVSEQTTDDDLLPKSATLTHFIDEDFWYPESNHKITFSFATLPDPAPKFIELSISYNPEAISVESVDPGNIWTSSTVLSSNIDNENGELVIALAQGFDSDLAGGNEEYESLYANILSLNIVTKQLENQDQLVFVVKPSSYYSSSDSEKEPFRNSIQQYEAYVPLDSIDYFY